MTITVILFHPGTALLLLLCVGSLPQPRLQTIQAGKRGRPVLTYLIGTLPMNKDLMIDIF